MELDRFLLLRGQSAERAPDPVVQLPRFLPRVGRRLRVHPDEAADRPPSRPVLDRRFPPGAQPALREVHHDAEEPGDKPIARPELAELEEGMQPRLLYDVLGVGPRAKDPRREACCAVAVPVDQEPESVPVTGEHPFDDLAVVLTHDPRAL